jgi:hypothetical protein
MLDYRAYLIGSDGHFYNAVPLKCTSDDEAIEKARQLVDGHDVELWQLDRKVAAFKSYPGLVQTGDIGHSDRLNFSNRHADTRQRRS